MTAVPIPMDYICADERGIAYIAGTRMKVTQIAVETKALGYSPQDIQDAHPHLSLAQIHAALAYYYAHQAEVDAEIERQDRFVAEMQAKHVPHITRAEWEERRCQKEASAS